MNALIPLLVFIALIAAATWMRRGHGGRIGRAVRESDHAAWRGAVEDKRRELAELIAAEPKR